ncbi:hypothetical protein VNI00_007213 [Paramarasmius palmivorus]|uniref:Uncharacterized protein n=1 Tax=Paramarasmius palmivorus TaxID=297713 RepID=A0AAW0D3R3_9AGAR
MSTMLYIHGLYTVFFGAYLYMMQHKRNNTSETARHHFFILFLTVALFILSTVFVVVYTMASVQSSLLIGKWGSDVDGEISIESEISELVTLAKILPVLLNTAADCILIDRCYLIWGSTNRVAIPLIVASIIVNGVWINLSLAAQATVTMFKGLGLVNGVTQIPAAMAKGANNSNLNKILMVVASTTWFAYLGNVFFVDLLPVLVLSSGIAPTLLLVRAKINTTTEEYRQTISDIRFPSQPRVEGEDYVPSPEIVLLIGKPDVVADDERVGENEDEEVLEQK